MNKISNKLFEDISPVLFIGALLISSFIFAQDNDEEITVDSVTIIGTKDDVKDLAGSGVITSALASTGTTGSLTTATEEWSSSGNTTKTVDTD